LGVGFISDYHIRPLSSLANIELSAVCDAVRGKALACQQRWNIPSIFDSLQEMLRSGTVDIVHILTPPSTHADAAVACLEAGCDIFVEKPLAISGAECERIRRAALRHGKTVGVNLNATCYPVFGKLIDAVGNWQLGAVEHVAACFNVPLRQLSAGQHDHWMLRDFGHIILELAPHPLSQIQRLLGSALDCSVTVSGATKLHTGAVFRDTWQIALLCERGTAQLLLSVGREFNVNTLHVIGQDGSAFLDLRRNTICLTEKSRFIDPVDNLRDGLQSARTLTRQALTNFWNYAAAFLKLKPACDPFPLSIGTSIRGFYDALEQGREPLSGLAVGADIISTCERIIQSASQQAQMSNEKALQNVTLL